RFQPTAVGDGMLVDDYAHHPKEVMATLNAARACWPDRHITAIFQPHRFTRTRDLMQEFTGAFDAANSVALLPIYAAGEAEIDDVNSGRLQEAMLLRGHRGVSLLADLDAARAHADDAFAEGHVVLLMGAGSIGALAQQIREGVSL
ncbi:MAG: glutamate ligase domain-containing protein, partial [Mariprofundus sp.]